MELVNQHDPGGMLASTLSEYEQNESPECVCMRRKPVDLNETVTEQWGITARKLSEERYGFNSKEIVILIVAFLRALRGEKLTYASVISFSLDHMPKPMADSTLSSIFHNLESYGFIVRENDEMPKGKAGRPREVFSISTSGLTALRSALELARQFWEGKPQAA